MNKKIIAMLLSVAMLAQGLGGSGLTAVQAVGAEEGAVQEEGQAGPEAMETHTLEEMEAEMPGLYDEASLESGSTYASKTLLVEADSDEFETFGASGTLCYNGIHVLTYGTTGQAMEAYEALSGLEGLKVEVDAVLETGTAGSQADESQGEPERQPSELKGYLDSGQATVETLAAIIDTGYTQGAENGRVADTGYNVSSSGEEGSTADDNGHGTQMGDIILGNTPDCVKIMPLKVANSQGKATVMSTYLAIQKAVGQGADLILISMNAKATADSMILTEAIREAVGQGIQVVASAGNSSQDVADIVPSNIEEVIVVSAVEDNGAFADYSNYGGTVDYRSYGTHDGQAGTSYSAAYVSAAVAYCNSIGEPYEGVFGKYLITYGEADGAYYGKGLVAFTDPAEPAEGEVPDDEPKVMGEVDEPEEADEDIREDENSETDGEDNLTVSAAANLALNYNVWLSNDENWTGLYSNGTKAGNTGSTNTSRRMESINIALANRTGITGGIRYRTHRTAAKWVDGSFTEANPSGGGWTGYVTSGNNSGTAGSGKHIEAVTLEFTGKLSNYYYIDYSAFTTQTPSGVAGLSAPASLRHKWIGVVDSDFLSKNPNWNPGQYNTTKNFAGTFMYSLPASAFKATPVARKIKYEVDSNGGIYGGTATGSMDANGTMNMPDPTRTGYTFTGWTMTHSSVPASNRNGYQSPASDIDGMLGALGASGVFRLYTAGNKDVVFKANWTINTSTLKVNPNGGTWSGSTATQSFTQNYNTTKSIPVPTRTGHTFAGWTRSGTNGSMTSITAAATYTFGATNGTTDTITASWTIHSSTLKVNPNSGTWNGSTATQSFTQNYNTTKSIPVPTRTGHTFTGWTRNGTNGSMTSTTVATTYTFGATNGATDTITANWNAIKYTVKYDRNDGTGSTEKGTGNMADVEHKYDEAKNLTKSAFERTYYNFTGWNTKADGSGKTYTDGESVVNLTTTNNATVTLYAQWEEKLFNVAYSGNGQTSGENMLEYNIWHADNFLIQENVALEKIEEEERIAESGETYTVEQEYVFQFWKFNAKRSDLAYMGGIPISAMQFYQEADAAGAISDGISEDISTYRVINSLGTAAAAKDYINLSAIWNAKPTIVTEPTPDIDEDNGPRIEDNTLFFYEGEEPTKEDLVAHLTVTDIEDGDLLDQLKIKKIVYSSGQYITADGTAKASDPMEWDDDIPEDYVFDTYYLEMERDETVTHMVTYEVTDSAGNTTVEELPAMVKYNNYPEIKAAGDYYTFRYFKEEANKDVITAEELIGRLEATDIEDGDKIKDKITLIDFDAQELKMQMTSVADFEVLAEVTDRFKKTTYRTITVEVIDPVALEAETLKRYTRFISLKYMDTLEPTSIWREPERWAYLKSILENETPVMTWYFTHEDVVKIQEWIFEDGDGHWKIGQEANREFLEKFGYCKIMDNMQ